DLKTKVNDRILQDRRTLLDELHIAFPDISRSLLGEIVSQHLGYHKICARPHTAASTRELLDQFGWEIFDHPPYSPDLAPSDFHLFTKLKDFLGGTRFGSDEELKKTVNTWLNELAAEEYNTGILKLVNRYDKCLNEEIHCVSSLDSNREADIVAIRRTQTKGIVLDPTIRFERDALQAQHVDEKKSIYESCIPYLIAIISPVMEYGAACWDPYRLEHIKTLEKIKKRALECCRNNSPLKWDTLTDRRTRIRFCAMFKTYRGEPA
ncbi:hypothetical protein ANN_20653, partial [Periplaneta americana]